jgi:hypothetical protein
LAEFSAIFKLTRGRPAQGFVADEVLASHRGEALLPALNEVLVR